MTGWIILAIVAILFVIGFVYVFVSTLWDGLNGG